MGDVIFIKPGLVENSIVSGLGDIALIIMAELVEVPLNLGLEDAMTYYVKTCNNLYYHKIGGCHYYIGIGRSSCHHRIGICNRYYVRTCRKLCRPGTGDVILSMSELVENSVVLDWRILWSNITGINRNSCHCRIEGCYCYYGEIIHCPF